jgi:hypothetical protein
MSTPYVKSLDFKVGKFETINFVNQFDDSNLANTAMDTIEEIVIENGNNEMNIIELHQIEQI